MRHDSQRAQSNPLTHHAWSGKSGTNDLPVVVTDTHQTARGWFLDNGVFAVATNIVTSDTPTLK